MRGHEGWAHEGDDGLSLEISLGDLTHELLVTRASGRRLSEADLHALPMTTPLRLAIRRRWSDKELAAWEDGKEETLESSIAAIVAEVIVSAEAAFRRSLTEAKEAEERHQRWLEERRLQELERLKAKRIVDLRTSGELLRQAQEIRSLVQRVGAAMLSENGAAIGPDRIESWKRWALAQADAIDPVISGQVLVDLHVSELDDGPRSSSE